jgi:hypothetical protein
MLRDALGNRLPRAQETRLRRILAEKDPAQYGARLKTRTDGSGCSLRWSSLPHGQKANSAGPDDPAICSLMRRPRPEAFLQLNIAWLSTEGVMPKRDAEARKLSWSG